MEKEIFSKMVIDFHTHAFPDAIANRAVEGLVKACNCLYEPCHHGKFSELIDNMDKFGVDMSVVLPVVTKPSQTKTVNEWAKEITGGNIISFGGIYPDISTYKQDIDLVCSLGLKGIKLHPEYQSFTVDTPDMLKIYDYALSKGLMLLFHAGFDPAYKPPYHSSPKQFANIVDNMRGGTIIAAHLGSARMWDDVEKYLVGKDIYLDTSMGFEYYPHDQFLRIVKNHGADKILFGSDSPWSRADEEIAALKTLPLTDAEKKLILGENAKRLLGVK